MGAKGSGPPAARYRKTKGAETAPPLGETPEEIRSAMAWVFERLVHDEIDARVADTMIKAARAGLSAAKEHAAQSEINRLQRMLEDAKKVDRAGVVREAADRLHASGKK